MQTKFISRPEFAVRLKTLDRAFIFQVVKIVLFCVLITTLLFSKSVFAKYYYFLMLVIVFIGLIPFRKKISSISKELKIFIAFAICFALFFYILFFPKINAQEMWGDEIGVILFSEKPFSEISESVLTQHAAAPPLDYWNMHYFRYAVDLFPVESQEFFYRIPYMIFHTVSTLLFLFTIEKLVFIQKKKKELNKFKMIVLCLAFSTYFFHPILFAYSLEVRFYELAGLGTILTIYLFLEKKLFDLRFLPILLLLILNSIFQLLTFVPFFILGFFDKQVSKKNFLVVFLTSAYLGVVLYLNVSKYQPVSEEAIRAIISHTLSNLLSTEFLYWWMYPVALLLLIIAFSRRAKLTSNLFFVASLQFLSITIISYIQGYFAFHIRHCLFFIPTILVLHFSAFNEKKNYLNYCVFAGIFLFLTVPWLNYSLQLFDHDFDISKYPIGVKKIIQLARKRDQVIMYKGEMNSEEIKKAEETNHRVDKGIYFFYYSYFAWYADKYKLEVVDSTDNQAACQYFNTHPVVLKINIYNFDKCDENSDSEIIFDTVLIESKYVPEKK